MVNILTQNAPKAKLTENDKGRICYSLEKSSFYQVLSIRDEDMNMFFHHFIIATSHTHNTWNSKFAVHYKNATRKMFQSHRYIQTTDYTVCEWAKALRWSMPEIQLQQLIIEDQW